MFDLRILIFVLVFYTGVDSVCPPGWRSHASSCYHFSHDTEEWNGALTICRELGGQLVEIEDAAEDHFILMQARKEDDRSYWIGLTDLQQEGTYVWMGSKTKLAKGDYSNWESGQPDNDDEDENCVNLEDSFNMLWNDLPCHTPIHYICERSNEDTDIMG